MKAIVLTFDSLNRHLLSAYGCEESITPNFKRLAEKTVVFDSAYVGSMPCMPARREMRTGRYNFLHTDWGGLEPYDASTPALLKKSGVYAHHCTDHYHYWEDGGHHHIQRYSSYECFRGRASAASAATPSSRPSTSPRPCSSTSARRFRTRCRAAA